MLVDAVADPWMPEKDTFWAFADDHGWCHPCDAEETVPSTESMGADALRRRIRRREVDESFSAALLKALEFAKGRDARYLPGWCGPNDGS